LEYQPQVLESKEQSSSDSIDWSAYSQGYDEMCFANPAYISNISELVSRLPSWGLSPNAKICDVGAGTGSFTCALGESLPGARFTHIDFDNAMNELAKSKYAERGLNVDIREIDAQKIDFERGTFDLTICVNSLYSMEDHDRVLLKMRSWTKPGGRLFIIDFGRKVEVFEWAVFILRNRIQKHGLRDTISWYRKNSVTIKQNRKGAKAQESGEYWLHSTEQFENSLERAGWRIEELKTCYREACDLAVCVNPP